MSSRVEASLRDDVYSDAMYLTVAYIHEQMSAREKAAYLQRFREDSAFRFAVVLNLATDHMQTHLTDEEAALLTRQERNREDAALWKEQMRVMRGFMKNKPTAEQVRLREMTWTYLMKRYGYPALDVVSWELVE